MLPSSRQTFKQYCLRKLGHPVITINVDESQVEDRVDEALALGQMYHYDLREPWYVSYKMTANDISNQCITLPNEIIGVTGLFTLSSAQFTSTGASGFNMFDINYQIRLNELYDYTAGDYVYFEMANEHLRMLEMLFTGEIPIRFNRYNHILYIDANWAARFAQSGDGPYIMIYGYRALDNWANFWCDPWLMKYGTALIKRQWGSNLLKFGSVALPGGMVLQGDKIYNEAVRECELLEKELRDQWEDPPQWIFG